MAQLTFHREILNERFPFQRVPEGDHIVPGTITDDDGAVLLSFDWPLTIKRGWMYPARVEIVDGKARCSPNSMDGEIYRRVK